MSAGAVLMGAQAGQSILQGMEERSAYKREARVQEQNARAIELQGEFDVLSALRKSRMEDGAMLADAAAGGGGGGAGAGGSMADILYANAVQRQMEAMNIRYSAAGQARAYHIKAAEARANAHNAIVNGVLRAGAATLSGISKANASSQMAGTAATERSFQPMGSIPVPRG